jgi:hypothetical protein
METYKFIQLDNEDILLQKIVIDDTIYTTINQNNGDILLKKSTQINITDINEIKNYNFKKSSILICSINNIKHDKLKFKSILDCIYKLINDGSKIIKNTKLNIKTIKKEDDGFYYFDDIGISIQGVGSNKCLFEIINQCIKNEIKLFMKIKLLDKNTINICFYTFIHLKRRINGILVMYKV